MKVAGFDIGGANTDLAIIDYENGEIKNIEVNFEYLPMWCQNDNLDNVLKDLIEKICPINQIDMVGISMTAELVDAYETKKDGVLDVVKKCEETFNCPTGYIGINGVLTKDEVISNPLKVAAANWIATTQAISLFNPNCVFIDTGSTTTDIIPINNGKASAQGTSDFERLATGELIYTGTLRTNLAAFTDSISLNDKNYSISSELFAQTADVYMILDEISIDDYVCDTYDGEGKSKIECARRIARIVCADLDILSYDDIVEMCNQIHLAQINQIAQGLKKVIKDKNTNVVTTGLGKDILAKKAAELLGLKVMSMNEFFTDEECVVAPAIGTAMMVANTKHL